MATKTSTRSDLIRVYLLNVEDIYYQFRACASSVAKRMKRGLFVDIKTLADSESIKSLQRKLNLYSLKYEGIKCAESGDRETIATEVIEEAEEINNE